MRIAFIGATTMGLQLFEPWTINGFGDRAPPSPEGQKAATFDISDHCGYSLAFMRLR